MTWKLAACSVLVATRWRRSRSRASSRRRAPRAPVGAGCATVPAAAASCTTPRCAGCSAAMRWRRPPPPRPSPKRRPRRRVAAPAALAPRRTSDDRRGGCTTSCSRAARARPRGRVVGFIRAVGSASAGLARRAKIEADMAAAGLRDEADVKQLEAVVRASAAPAPRARRGGVRQAAAAGGAGADGRAHPRVGGRARSSCTASSTRR